MAVNTTPVELTVTQVDGDTDLVEVFLQVPVLEVQVIVPGSQGIPGPQGLPGPTGSGYYEEFLVAQLQWTINHNLGRRPLTQVFSVGGVEMWAEVIHMSINQSLYLISPQLDTRFVLRRI